MREVEFQESVIVKKPKIITKRHSEIIDTLEKMLEKGVPEHLFQAFFQEYLLSLNAF